KNNPEIFEPFKININTGEIERIYENSNLEKPVDEFILDRAGVLRAIVQKVGNTDYQVRFRRTAEEEFQEVVTYSWQDQFSVLEMHQENKDLAYVATNIGKDKTEIVLYDMTKRQQVETLFQHPDFDADDLTFSKKRNFEIDYFEYVGEKEKMIPVSPTFQKLHQTWTEKFSPNQFSVVDRTKAEDKFLLYVNSDKIYGRYYLYDVATDEFTLLMDLMPNLKEEDMAEMRPIRFKSRDGYNIHAYITLPKAVANGEKVPLIVNPHGGPYGVRDIWDFNPETQLFASRGYATLQINYRGSGGYGKKFYLAGSKQIGRKMLDDLEDGVQFVLDQGWIDKDRIAIYGGSYGGLATLGSLIKTPDLYKCGVDYVGVSNFFTFINSFPAYWKPYMEEFYAQWYDPDIPEEKKIMEEVSPALNIDKLNKPVFVVQGANDPRVNIHESDQIVEQLRAKGYEVPYMVKYNEGHGFSHEENRIELYRSMLGFFKMHLQ
ncbi:MAG: S9 family peptidase, partial [Bacteroidota bacterium]